MHIGSIGGFSGFDPSKIAGFTNRAGGSRPSPDEFAGKLVEKLDSDSDGALSASELSESKLPFSEELFANADTDDDGFLTETEIATQAEELLGEFGNRPPPNFGSGTIDFSSLLAENASKVSSNYQSGDLSTYLLQQQSALSLSS